MPNPLPERFIRAFKTNFPQYNGSVTRELTAAHVTGWDSVAHGNLIMELEDAYDTEIDARQAFSCETLGELLDMFEAGHGEASA
ncbi:MAG: acyl carrier protein [Pseudomonadota bacterium]